jgi:quercetin dioxygenase-like cupin family protein
VGIAVMRPERWLLVVATIVASCGAARSDPALPGAASPPASSAATSPSGQIRLNAADLEWKDAPPGLPSGAKTAVLEGDPRKPGFFTMRLKLPAGGRLEPHTHPADERVTVLSGSVRVGFGETFDPAKGKTFTAGAFYVNPMPMPHFVWTDEGCVLQVTGIGPWGLTYVDSRR